MRRCRRCSLPQISCWRSTMSFDPVVEEVHRIREELAARFNYDIAAIAKYARERDAAGDCEVIRRPPRRPVVPANVQPLQSSAAAFACPVTELSKSNGTPNAS